MGGAPKGLLEVAPGETIVERWRAMLGELAEEVVLVGSAASYASLGVAAIADDPAGIGPLGGVVALLEHAGERVAIAVACDMPYVSRALLQRLVSFRAAPLVAPRRDGRWETMLARFDAPRVLPVARAHVARVHRSLQALFDASGAVELPIDARESEELRDWDTPEDTGRARK
jgi:molybdopterin-guanine dinucleotide biosynthesis protein A